MRALPSARSRAIAPGWRKWNGDALTVLRRSGSVRVEPAPWLAPHQARRLHALIDDLLTYHCVHRLAAQIPGADHAMRKQASEIAARVVELIQAGVRIRWQPAAGDSAIRLMCMR